MGGVGIVLDEVLRQSGGNEANWSSLDNATFIISLKVSVNRYRVVYFSGTPNFSTKKKTAKQPITAQDLQYIINYTFSQNYNFLKHNKLTKLGYLHYPYNLMNLRINT